MLFCVSEDVKQEDVEDAAEQSSMFSSPHRLAVIVPYRDRFEELRLFVPHIHKYLKEKGIDHQIYIINQADKHRLVVLQTFFCQQDINFRLYFCF